MAGFAEVLTILSVRVVDQATLAGLDEWSTYTCLELAWRNFLHTALQAYVANVIVWADLSLCQAAAEAFGAFKTGHALPGKEALCAGIEVAPERLLISTPLVSQFAIRDREISRIYRLERSVN